MAARRSVLLVVVLAGTVSVAGFALWRRDGTGTAPTPEAAAPGESAPGKVSEAPAKELPASPADRVRAALAREVSFPGVDDPKTTLGEVLDRLAKQWGVRFDVKGEDAESVLKREIADPPIPPMRMQADWVLWSVLRDEPPGREESPAIERRLAYLVSDDRILVAPHDWFTERGLTPERPSRDTPRMVARARGLREKLARVVDFPGINDPKTTLGEALERLGKVYGLNSFVDVRAFKDEQLNDVLRTGIADPPIPRMRGQLYLVVAKILSRVGVPSGANFVVAGDHLWIGTGDGFQRLGIDPEPPPKFTAKMKRRLTDYRTALTREVSFPGVDDPKAALGEVLDQLAKRYDLTIVVEERAFKCFQINDVLNTEIASSRPIPTMKAPLAKVLQVVLDRVPVEESKATYAVRPGGIVVTVEGAPRFPFLPILR